MAQIWDDGGGGGETTDVKNALDEAELRNNGAAVAAWWIDTTGNPVEAWNALSREAKIASAGQFRALYGRGAGWEDGDAGEDEIEGGGGSGPPTGSDEIEYLFDGEKWGVRVRIWAKGYRLGIWYGDKPADFYVYDFTNGDMVDGVARIIEYIKAAGEPPAWSGL